MHLAISAARLAKCVVYLMVVTVSLGACGEAADSPASSPTSPTESSSASGGASSIVLSDAPVDGISEAIGGLLARCQTIPKIDAWGCFRDGERVNTEAAVSSEYVSILSELNALCADKVGGTLDLGNRELYGVRLSGDGRAYLECQFQEANRRPILVQVARLIGFPIQTCAELEQRVSLPGSEFSCSPQAGVQNGFQSVTSTGVTVGIAADGFTISISIGEMTTSDSVVMSSIAALDILAAQM